MDFFREFEHLESIEEKKEWLHCHKFEIFAFDFEQRFEEDDIFTYIMNHFDLFFNQIFTEKEKTDCAYECIDHIIYHAYTEELDDEKIRLYSRQLMPFVKNKYYISEAICNQMSNNIQYYDADSEYILNLMFENAQLVESLNREIQLQMELFEIYRDYTHVYAGSSSMLYKSLKEKTR